MYVYRAWEWGIQVVCHIAFSIIEFVCNHWLKAWYSVKVSGFSKSVGKMKWHLIFPDDRENCPSAESRNVLESSSNHSSYVSVANPSASGGWARNGNDINHLTLSIGRRGTVRRLRGEGGGRGCIRPGGERLARLPRAGVNPPGGSAASKQAAASLPRLDNRLTGVVAPPSPTHASTSCPLLLLPQHPPAARGRGHLFERPIWPTFHWYL